MREPASPPPGDPVQRFFANALIAVGWLILTLGGFCIVIFGLLAVGDRHEFHIRMGDWMLPLSLLAVGGGTLMVGRGIKRAIGRAPMPDADG
jgi:hypothetical protein